MFIKNDIFEVIIIELGCNGEGIAKRDNIVIFVPFTLVGERVKIKILQVKKSFAYGKVMEVIAPAKQRVIPKCLVFDKCGGCDLQHMSYESQLQYKTELVKNTLKKVGNLHAEVLPCAPSPLQLRYRNKLQMPIGRDNNSIAQVGFYAVNSHRIVPITDCLLQPEWNRNIIKAVTQYMQKYNVSAYNEELQKGLLRHVVVREIDGVLLITMVINGSKLQNHEGFIAILNEYFDNFTVCLNINKENNNVIMGEKTFAIHGSGFIESYEYGLKSQVGAQTFMQVNNGVKKLIYDKVIDIISGLNISTVIDAYSGAGVLSCMLSKHAEKVYGIEIIPEAVECANDLCKRNDINNVTSIVGDCAIELPKLIKIIGGNLAVVLDPPRKGCDEKVLDAVKASSPRSVIYISCNPATLARDIAYLSNDYEVSYVQPYDLFPQTKHVETVVGLRRK